MYTLLVTLHVAAGVTALIAAAIAISMPKGGPGHTYAGRAFVIGMAGVFVTALPMTLIKPNLFLLLIAVFSFYMALTGWLRARNRRGLPTRVEWTAAAIMAVTALAMAVRGATMVWRGESIGIVLIVFAVLGGQLARGDLVSLRARRYTGTHRIVAHLTRMLGGTIATVTAFTVVNVRFEPAFVVWLAPAVALTPVVMYWGMRTRRAAGPSRS